VKNTYKYISLIIIVLSFFASHAKAQSKSKITGTVYDSETGEALIGVNVSIEGTFIGSATDIDGNFVIVNVAPGTYNLKASYVSYSDKRIEGVIVEAGKTVNLRFDLSPESFGLEEVTVTAEALKNSDAALLSIQRKAVGMQDGISAQMISNSGSGDAAGAMTKVVGASVVGGKYVFVRGLGDRYTNTQLNGLELPTSDPDKKSFQLDLFPAGLLDNITTLKTFTPDKPGNFSGGLVDVSTKGIPDNLFFSMSAKQGFNTQASFQNLLLGESGNKDWLGYDDGGRNAPELISSRTSSDFPSSNAARFDPVVAQDLDLLANSMTSTFLPQEREVGMNQSYSISLGNRHTFLKDVTFGYSGSYSYSMNNSGYKNGQNARYDLLGMYDETKELTPIQVLNDQKGSQSVDWGALGTAGLIIGQSSKINFSYLRTQSGENTGRYLNGYWEQFNSDDVELRSRVNQFVERNLTSYQLSGKHNFAFLNNVQLDWNSAIQSNGQQQPDARFIASDARFIRDVNGLVVDTLLGNSKSQHPRPARLFRDLSETKKSGTVDLTIPINFDFFDVKIKTGGLYESTSRYFTERRYEYEQGSGFTMNTFNSEAAYLDTRGIIGYDSRNRAQIGNYIVSATSDRSSYDADQNIGAYYGMIEFSEGDFKIVTGARYEKTDLETVSRDSTLLNEDRYGIIKQNDILPSLVLIYSYSKNVNLRAAYSKTIARPTFRELAPYISFDFVGDNLFRGNAQLQRTLITNYDLRYEWYPEAGEIITVSGFYKRLEKPLERVLRFEISEKAESIQNVDLGTVLGIEFELRKNLGAFSQSLRNFSLTTNLTFVNSVVDIPESELVQMRQTNPNPETTRPLAGQSPYIINADLTYANTTYGITSTLSYNKFGDRLSRVTLGSAPNVYERSYSSLNFNFNKRLNKSLTLNFSATNILDPDIKFTQEFKGEEYIFQKYRLGRTIILGIKYDL
jgi:hypothetical protein